MRSARSDLLANGLAVVARLASGTALFVVLGRLLGPEAFGNFMAAMAGAALLAYLSNLGLTQQVLREVAVRSADAARASSELLSTKLMLAVLLVAVALLTGAVGGHYWWAFAVLAVALVCDGIVEFLFALLKAHGHYGAEAGFTTVAAIIHLVLVSAVCIYWPDIVLIACAFALSRVLQLGAAVFVCRAQMPLPAVQWSLGVAWRQVRQGWAYAVDVGLGQLAAQLDTVLVRLLLGAHAAGIYQAGMRVVVGMLMLSVVAGNVFIPRLTRTLGDPAAHGKVVSQVGRTYGAMALASGGGVIVLGAAFTQWGYGQAYSALWGLWPWFAALVVVRVLAANYGVRLTALGQQGFRSAVNAVSLVVAVGLMVGLVLAAGFGLHSVLGALLAAAALVWFAYRWRVHATRKP